MPALRAPLRRSGRRVRLRALIANVPLFPGVSYRADALNGGELLW